jgi:hypothetical protein
MTKQKFIFQTIEEVQAKQAELKSIYGNDNVMTCLNRDVYFHVTFNIFK